MLAGGVALLRPDFQQIIAAMLEGWLQQQLAATWR
jgi:hypothetical protein